MITEPHYFKDLQLLYIFSGFIHALCVSADANEHVRIEGIVPSKPRACENCVEWEALKHPYFKDLVALFSVFIHALSVRLSV